MKSSIRSRILPAAALLAFGVALVSMALDYRLGTLTAMGPGFMPVLLGTFLALLALLALWQAWRGEEQVAPLPWRPLLAVAGGLLVWVLLAERAGFFVAALAQLVLSSTALPGAAWRSVGVASLLFTLVAFGLFVLLLGLPLRAFGG